MGIKNDINKFKVAIFDFDDTLAIHKDKDFLKHRNESESNFINYYAKAYLNSETFYEEIEPCFTLEPIKKLVTILKNNGVKVYCLTGTKFSFNLKAKEIFIHKNYGNDIEIVSTQSQERKVDAVKIIKYLNSCKLEEILFVDDLEENIVRLNQLGVCAVLATNIDL